MTATIPYDSTIIACVISSLIAVGIFLGNQAFENKRKRIEHLRVKLEDLFTALEEVTRNSLILDPKDAISCTNQNVVFANSLDRPRMLVKLYFPELKIELAELDTVTKFNSDVMHQTAELLHLIRIGKTDKNKYFDHFEEVQRPAFETVSTTIDKIKAKLIRDYYDLVEEEGAWN